LKINTLLVDADGVIQHMRVPWGVAFAALLETKDSAVIQRFTAQIYAAEATGMAHGGGYMDELARTLASWNLSAKLENVVAAMHNIQTYDANMSVIQSIRRKGVGCHLASNQEVGRARHMSIQLGYKSLFDKEFYSCFLGVAKPHAGFFEKALALAGTDAGSTLFLDDKPENVESAKRAGLHAVVVKGEHGPDTLREHLAKYGLDS
jgi:putative hydrolase of the HAD superfamily